MVAGSTSSSAQDILTHLEFSHVNNSLLPYRIGDVLDACATGISCCIRYVIFLTISTRSASLLTPDGGSSAERLFLFGVKTADGGTSLSNFKILIFLMQKKNLG